MNKRCPNCKRLFKSYWTGQKYCCYNCAREAETEGKRVTIADVLALGGEKSCDYGRLVLALERRDNLCITRG
jgi:hypothetical protein